MQGRGGRPDDGRGWEGRKQRRDARADGSGASAGAGGERAGAGGERAWVGGGRGGATGPGKSEWGFGGKSRDEAGIVRILG